MTADDYKMIDMILDWQEQTAVVNPAALLTEAEDYAEIMETLSFSDDSFDHIHLATVTVSE